MPAQLPSRDDYVISPDRNKCVHVHEATKIDISQSVAFQLWAPSQQGIKAYRTDSWKPDV